MERMRIQAHFRLSKPYLNKETLHFERKVLGVGKYQCIPSSYYGHNVTMIGDFFNGVYYYPFVFDPKKNIWFGKCVSVGESSESWTSYRLKDYKFGTWYKKNWESIVKPLLRKRIVFMKKSSLKMGKN
ncbi:MAG: hypothetical protein QW719_02550 [Candidatus Micrarchaeaceae archaeon]